MLEPMRPSPSMPSCIRTISLWPRLWPAICSLAARTTCVGLESELALEVLQRSGGPERAHPDDGAAATRVPLPAKRGGSLHRDARGDLGWDDAVAVFPALMLE